MSQLFAERTLRLNHLGEILAHRRRWCADNLVLLRNFVLIVAEKRPLVADSSPQRSQNHFICNVIIMCGRFLRRRLLRLRGSGGIAQVFKTRVKALYSGAARNYRSRRSSSSSLKILTQIRRPNPHSRSLRFNSLERRGPGVSVGCLALNAFSLVLGREKDRFPARILTFHFIILCEHLKRI